MTMFYAGTMYFKSGAYDNEQFQSSTLYNIIIVTIT